MFFFKIILLPFLLLVLLSNFFIATADFVSYQLVYDSVPASFPFSLDDSSSIHGGAVETSFMHLMSLAKSLNLNFLLFYFACMYLVIVTHQYVFFKYYNSWFWGLIALSSWTLIIFANNFRLAIASAILIAFINLLVRGYFLLYLLVIALASTFHVAASSFLLIAVMFKYDFFYQLRYPIIFLTLFAYFANFWYDLYLIQFASAFLPEESYLYGRILAYSLREDARVSIFSFSGLRNVIILCISIYIDFKFRGNQWARLFLCLNFGSFFYLYSFSAFVVVGTYFHNLLFTGFSLMVCFAVGKIKIVNGYCRLLIMSITFFLLFIQFLFITRIF